MIRHWWTKGRLALVALLLVAGVAHAHGHAADSTATGARQAGATAGSAAPGETLRTGTPRDQAPYRMPPLGQALFDHLHNKLVHFPIVVTLLATVFLVLGRRRPELEALGFWLVWVAALSTLAAYFSGQAQSQAFEHEAKAWLVQVHRKQGITVGIAQAVWVLSLLRERTRRHAWLLGLVVSFLVLASAFIGGLIAHGE